MSRSRILWAAGILLVVLLALNYLLTHSTLTITSSGPEPRTVYIRKEGFEEKTVLKNSQKKYTLRPGNYEIEVVSGDSQSIYYRHLDILKRQKLAVETIDPKSESLLGKSDLRCARLGPAGKPVFYSCYPSSGGQINLQGEAGNNSAPGESSSTKQTGLSTTSLAMQPSGQGFIEARTNSSGLVLSQRFFGGSSQKILGLDSFKGQVNDGLFAVVNNNYAVFDTKTGILYYSYGFNKTGKVQLKQVDFSGKDFRYAQVYNSLGFVYILSSTGEEVLGGGQQKPDYKSKILIVDKSKGALIKNKDLDYKWSVQNAVAANNDLYIVIGGDFSPNTYKITAGGRTSAVPGLNNVSQICALGDNLYYLNDDGRIVYRYSFSKNASFRVYKNSSDTINSISCLDGKFYFSIINSRDEDLSTIYHYTLGGYSQNKGVELSSVLPLFITLDQDTLKFEEAADGVKATLFYDNNGNGFNAFDQAKARLLQILNEKGVDTSRLNISFDF